MPITRCEDCANRHSASCNQCTVSNSPFAIPTGFEPIFIEKSVAPPLGLTPRYINDQFRMTDIQKAIIRYASVGARIPAEWLTEYNELAAALRRK